MGAAVRRPLAGQHRTGRTVNRIWEGDWPFRESVLMTCLRGPLNLLGPFQILPLLDVIPKIILLWDIVIHDIAQELVRTMVVRLCFDRRDVAV